MRGQSQKVMELEMELVDSIPAPAVEAPSPAEAVAEVTPAVEDTTPTEVTTEPAAVEPSTPETQLFETPDGRQVDAATLAREWKENFYPEFTRKSQELAALKTPANQPAPITNEEPDWKNPDFSPKSWAEAIEIAKAEAIKEIVQGASAAEQQRAAVLAQVDTTLSEIKTTDPKLDENALFDHATKYGFTDLKAAHSNMQAMKAVALSTEQRVLKDLGVRAKDPISASPSAPTTAPKVEFDSVKASGFRSALDYLEAIKRK